MKSGNLHPVVWAPFSWEALNDFVRNLQPEVTSMAILTDENVYSLHKSLIDDSKPSEVHLLLHEAGEKGKSWQALGELLRRMLRTGLDRHSLLVIVGGGALCDAGGLAAALYMRGIRCVYVPTTLLAMVDGALGGKTAVNLGAYKNMAGLFRMPEAVWCDARFLESLSPTALAEGVAEMLKHGMVADKKHLEDILQLHQPHDILNRSELIKDSQQIKLRIVELDPSESGPRALLNFGHTVGHALESYYIRCRQPVPHGLCVASGMLAEIQLSVRATGFDADEAANLTANIKRLFGPLLPAWPPAQSLLPFMMKDKKNSSGSLRFTLMRQRGEAIPNVQVAASQVLKVLKDVSLKA